MEVAPAGLCQCHTLPSIDLANCSAIEHPLHYNFDLDLFGWFKSVKSVTLVIRDIGEIPRKIRQIPGKMKNRNKLEKCENNLDTYKTQNAVPILPND